MIDLRVETTRPDLVGQVVLDRYVVEAVLGSGAMGTVYRGRHQKLPRSVAIKVLHDEFGREPIMLERFRREARIAARMAHANVIAVIDVGETADGRQVMVLELAQGENLSALIARGPMAGDRVIRIVRQLLRGLDHAHAAGLIHRDLKPDNVIVEMRDGEELPRIVDFGIAILAASESFEGVRLTDTGVVIGTPLYMAPEQAKCEPIDHRVDLFALGVMTYEMVSGRVPFDGNATEIALASISKDPPPIAKRSGVAVDPLLERFVRKLMARRLRDRFSTAFDALGVLDLIERDRDAAALALGQMNVARALETISLK
jgi:serine/threonine-protein kinase